VIFILSVLLLVNFFCLFSSLFYFHFRLRQPPRDK